MLKKETSYRKGGKLRLYCIKHSIILRKATTGMNTRCTKQKTESYNRRLQVASDTWMSH